MTATLSRHRCKAPFSKYSMTFTCMAKYLTFLAVARVYGTSTTRKNPIGETPIVLVSEAVNPVAITMGLIAVQFVAAKLGLYCTWKFSPGNELHVKTALPSERTMDWISGGVLLLTSTCSTR